MALLLLALSTALPAEAGAHVPVASEGNEELSSATRIEDPAKSWAIYDSLEGAGDVRYFSLEMRRGDLLKVSMFTPEEGDFTPSLVVMGPGVESSGHVPDFVERPEGGGVLLVEGHRESEGEYEPFTPAGHYRILEFEGDVNATGRYYLAVFEPDGGGKFGMAVGYEERFGPDEWILVPVDVVSIRLWEGQSPYFIFAPMAAAFAVGVAGIIYRRRRGKEYPRSVASMAAVLGGLAYFGSGAMVLAQMGVALSTSPAGPVVAVTLAFALIPMWLGWRVMSTASRMDRELDHRGRLGLTLLGLAGLVTWAGLIFGPVLVVSSALLSLFKQGQRA